MQFILTAEPEQGITAIAERLQRELASGQRVLWLVSGGSNVPACVTVMQRLPAELTPGLSITLCDERYGVVGHADSNWDQLEQAGFDGKQAHLLPVLEGDLSLEATAARYTKLVEAALTQADSIVAQLGMGADGHIAGILPGSAAVSARGLVCGYQAPPYQRLTLTFPALRQLTAAYVLAFGAAKHQALRDLQAKALPLDQQPAQILKELTEAYIYNDQIGQAA